MGSVGTNSGVWRLARAAAAVAAMLAVSSTNARAADCGPEQLAAAIDAAGERLRGLTAASKPALESRLEKLKRAKDWSDQEYQEKGYAALEDERTAKLDATANQLLARIDALGGDKAGAGEDCARIGEIEAVSLELQATVRAKSNYVLGRLDQLIAESGKTTLPGQIAVAPPPTPSTPAVVMPAAPKPPEKSAKIATAVPQPATPPSPKVQPRPPARSDSQWATQTEQTPAAAPPPQVAAAPPPPIAATEPEGYTIDEIVDASRGLFGKVSANLARVLEHAFAESGRPTGYILGQETGGAFIAGLRYGSGTLYLRAGGSLPIYWHGPSLGADVGAQGTATLFLIYKARQPADVMSNFTGIEGSAFVVGGLGMTFMNNGHVQMAPIRSGIGLRIGANLGYIRFTAKPTWNPF